MSIGNVQQSVYTLSVNEDGRSFYYAEDGDGSGHLSQAVEKISIGFMGVERASA